VAVLTRPLDRGEVIQEADVAVERRDRRTIGEGTVTDPLELVGLATRRPLREGDVVRPDHVEPPRVVRRGQLVTMVYESPGLALTARGRALADGAVGDAVSVINEQSRRTVDATVIGPDKVRIAGPALRTAAAPAAQTVE
jgi:flagella basal body P-ring formation protein FlgA